MHALGNDFVVLDLVREEITITSELIRHIADRHRGIGCDQVLLLTRSENPAADFGYRIFNADGNEVNQCGNGARCIGLFLAQEKLSDKKTIVLATRYDVMRLTYFPDNQVQVDIAKPNFNPSSLPFITDENAAPYQLQLKKHLITFDAVSVGNPHCVLQRDHFSQADIIEIGEELNAHPAFPEGVNVGFMHCESRNLIQLCVYERGAGLTQACGSGACAAVAVGRQRSLLNAEVEVRQAGGVVHVAWESEKRPIQLRGSAVRVYDGKTSCCSF